MSSLPNEVKGANSDRFPWEKALRDSQLPSRARHVGHLMATYADKDGSSIHPGVDRMAKGTGMSSRTVHTALKELRLNGWVKVVVQSNSWRGQSHEYRLTIPAADVQGSPASSTSTPATGLFIF